MAKNRKCGRCSSNLADIDPHNICKSCRQPDPIAFYCDTSCEACEVIKAYKPLDLLLKKKELDNISNASVQKTRVNKPGPLSRKNRGTRSSGAAVFLPEIISTKSEKAKPSISLTQKKTESNKLQQPSPSLQTITLDDDEDDTPNEEPFVSVGIENPNIPEPVSRRSKLRTGNNVVFKQAPKSQSSTTATSLRAVRSSTSKPYDSMLHRPKPALPDPIPTPTPFVPFVQPPVTMQQLVPAQPPIPMQQLVSVQPPVPMQQLLPVQPPVPMQQLLPVHVQQPLPIAEKPMLNERELESRICDRIMSKLIPQQNLFNLQSLIYQEVNQLKPTIGSNVITGKEIQPPVPVREVVPEPSPPKKEEPPTPPQKEEIPVPDIVSSKNEDAEKKIASLASSTDNKLDLFLAFLESSDVNCVSKSANQDNYTMRVSPSATDILIKSTILSSPSAAQILVENLNLPKNLTTWPASLNAMDLLHADSQIMPSMKLHPKARQLHDFLFNKLKPTLPSELIEENFSLPELSIELKNEFLFAREQLLRLLLLYSLIENYCSAKLCDESPSSKLLFEVMCEELEIALQKQANFLGLLFRELRSDLLSHAKCDIKSVIPNLANGPIHFNQFFGPYVKELQNILKTDASNGKNYKIKPSVTQLNVTLFKLPEPLKDVKQSIIFFETLEKYLKNIRASESEKIKYFNLLIPELLIQKLHNLTDKKYLKSYEDYKTSFNRIFGKYSDNLLEKRKLFSSCKQDNNENAASFGEKLENLCINCNYGIIEKEILRDNFVFGLQDEAVQKHLLKQQSISFHEALDYAIKNEEPELEIIIKKEAPPVMSTRRKHQSVVEKIDLTEDSVFSSPVVQIPLTPKNQKKSASKRKLEPQSPEHFEGFKSERKKFKADSNQFYASFSSLLPEGKEKTVKMKKKSEWQDHFGQNATLGYLIYCPWTGNMLRG